MLKSVFILAQQTKPNLVFVFSDQQSFDMLGCYGNKQIKTPEIDKLASEGVRFNDCISSTPVCSPYRAMLLTGQHNLFYDPNYAEVRQEMFEKAVAWMKKYEDPMIGAPELFELGEVDNTPKLDGKGKTGELSARPADLIKATNYKRKIPARMPDAEETKVLLEKVCDRKINNIEGVYQEKIEMSCGVNIKTKL